MSRMIRVFISSTFTGFDEARNTLVADVFPEIRKMCLEKGFSFRAVDLRWGITENEGRQHHVADICFEEIRRCIKYSPAPNFIVLSDDYYGWIPAPASISRDCWTLIRDELARSSPEGLEYLQKWYRRDLNDAAGSMILQEKCEETGEYDFNDVTEKRINDILFPAAQKVLPDLYSLRVAFGGSLTEQEINEGLFSQEGASEHTLVMIREERRQEEPGAESREESSSFNAHNLNKHLKAVMCDGDRRKWIPLREETMAEDALRFLSAVVERQIREVLREEERELDFERELREQREALAQAAEDFIDLGDRLRGLEEFVKKNRGRTFVIKGKQGSGKSTLLKYYVHSDYDRHIGVFAELQGGRNTLDAALRFFIDSLISRGDFSQIVERGPGEGCVAWFEHQMEFLRKDAAITMVLDSAELITDFRSQEESLFSLRLPEGAALLVSCVDESSFSAIDVQYNPPVMELEDLRGKDCVGTLLEMIAKHGRTLTAFQQGLLRNLIPEKVTPLYLRQAAGILKGVRAYSESDGLTPECSMLPEDTGSLIRSTLEWYGKAYIPGLYRHVLSYIAMSARGVSEEELIGLLMREMMRGSELNDELLRNSFWKIRSREHVVNIFWSRMRYHLEEFLVFYPDHENILIRFRHGMIREAAVSIVETAMGDGMLLKSPEALNFRDYWMEQGAYSAVTKGTVIANRRRADELFPILLDRDEKNQLRNILGNMYDLDAMIRLERYGQLMNLLENAERDGYGSARIHAVLILLQEYEILLSGFSDSFLPLCVQLGLAGEEVLAAVGTNGHFEERGEFPTGFAPGPKPGHFVNSTRPADSVISGGFDSGPKPGHFATSGGPSSGAMPEDFVNTGGIFEGVGRGPDIGGTGSRDAKLWIPGCVDAPMAMRGDGVMAVMDRGSVRIYDWNRRRYSSASYPLLTRSGDCLYWIGDRLILRRYRKRLIFHYLKTPRGIGEMLRLEKEEDCPTLLNLFNDNEVIRRAAGRIEEEDSAGERSDRIVNFHFENGTPGTIDLAYPFDEQIRCFLHYAQAAIVKENGEIDFVDLDAQRIRETIYKENVTGVFYSDDGKSVLLRTRMNTVIFHRIEERGSRPMPVFRGSKKQFLKEIRAADRDRFWNTAIMFAPRKKRDLPYQPVSDPTEGRPYPTLTCMSAVRGWMGGYYYYNDIAIVRIFDLKTGEEILSSEVEPIYRKDIEDNPFRAEDGGDTLVIQSSGIVRELSLISEKPVWRRRGAARKLKSTGKEKTVSAQGSGTSHGSEEESSVDLLLLKDYERHMWRWIPHRHQYETLEDITVNTFDTAAGRIGFRLLRMYLLPLTHILMPEKINNPEYYQAPRIIRTEEYIWLIDTAGGTVHVSDREGRWLGHTQVKSPFIAIDAKGNTLYLLSERYESVKRICFVKNS